MFPTSVDFTNNLAGVPRRQAVGRNIFGDHAPGSDDASFSDGNAGQDNDAAANPATVFYRYGKSVGMADVFDFFIRFHGSEAFIQLNGVCSGVNLYVGGDQHIVADGDPVAVHERAARIDGDVVPDMDVAAVIADEGMADGDLGADAAQHFLEHLALFLLMVVRQGIVFHQEPMRLILEFQKHLVMAVVPFARHAFFQFSHYFLLS